MRSYADISLRARQLHAANAQPSIRWTLPQVCDHLAKSMLGSAGALGPRVPTPPPKLINRLLGNLLVMTLGIIPKGVKSPERVTPKADVTWDDAIASLEKAVAYCQQKSQTNEPWLAHPMIGFTDSRSWERFHLIHARHHFACLRIPHS